MRLKCTVAIIRFVLAVQMAQAGQLTLELPYVIIGLGSTPNFVEKITVGVPPMSDTVSNERNSLHLT